MIDNDDMKRIVDRMRETFVTRDECNNRMEDINRNLATLTTEIALIKQTLDRISWTCKTTRAAVIAALVGAFLKLVLLP